MRNLKRAGLGAALALAFLSGCGGNKNVSAGGTGAFGVVTVNGKQKLYLPLTDLNASGHGAIAVVDVGKDGKGVSGDNALITMIDLGTTDYATTTGGDPTVIVAASTDNPTIWLIDPTTDKLTKTLALDATAGRSSFSGGGGYVTGVAMDSDHNRAILSVWNGFALLDTKAGTITKTIEAPPVENFGFDSAHQRIIAPFYECADSADAQGNRPAFCGNYTATDGSPMTDGLNVIDLSDGTVYTYQDPSATDPHTPLGTEPDSAAADPNNQIVVVPSEGENLQNVIDLSKATFDKSKKTVTAPSHRVPNLGLTGAAIEATRHYAFLEEEHSSDVAFFKIEDANQGKGAPVTGNVPSLPDGNGWSNLGDPHGIAVTTALNGGKSVGFVVNDARTWVARVDLEKFEGLASNGAGYVSDMSAAVTFLNARQ